jgi:pyruvate dehydrogenase E2 component (dihydrolipoamide acetyltransferase)
MLSGVFFAPDSCGLDDGAKNTPPSVENRANASRRHLTLSLDGRGRGEGGINNFSPHPSPGLRPPSPASGEGKEDSAPLIFLHGWGQSSKTFTPLVRELRERGVTSFAFDFPGHGDARDEPGSYSFDHYASLIGAFAKSIGASRFHLAGWSMGGTIAAIHCLEQREPRPLSLVLIASTPRFVAQENNLGEGQHPAAVKKMERMISSDHNAGLREFIGRFFESGEIIPESMKAQIENLLIPENFPPNKDALLSTLKELSALDLTISGRKWDGPVLNIQGTADKITLKGGQRLWRGLFGDITEAPMESAGHAPHLTQTAGVAEIIAGFLSSLE